MNRYYQNLSYDLYDLVHLIADNIFDFLAGYISFFESFSTYKDCIVWNKKPVKVFWFCLNRYWLLDHHGPEEIFINDSI